MAGQTIGYIRVSSEDQNPDRQLEGINLDKKFIEFASGKSVDRPMLRDMINYVREDDVIMVHSMDRMARNLRDLRNTVDQIIHKKAKITFLKENLSFTGKDNPLSLFFLSVMGAFAEFELSIMKERQREGIEMAKKRGVYSRKRVKFFDKKVNIELLRDGLMTRKPLTHIAMELGIKKSTVYDFLKLHAYDSKMDEPWTVLDKALGIK